jgi:hypothetical protein
MLSSSSAHESKATLPLHSKRTCTLLEASSAYLILHPPRRPMMLSIPIKRDGNVGSLSAKTKKGHFTVLPPTSNVRSTLLLVEILPPPTPVKRTLLCVPKSAVVARNLCHSFLSSKGFKIEHGLPVSMKTGRILPCTFIIRVGDLHGLNWWSRLPWLTFQTQRSGMLKGFFTILLTRSVTVSPAWQRCKRIGK